MPHATPSPKPTSPPPTPTFPSARLINANYANPNPVPLRCSIILERGEGGRDTRADSQLIIVIDIHPLPSCTDQHRPFEVTTERKGRERRALISDDFSEEEGGRDKPRRINRAISHDSSSSPILFRFSDPSNYIARSYREGTLWNLNLC